MKTGKEYVPVSINVPDTSIHLGRLFDEQGLSVKDVARELEVSQQAVYQWRDGNSEKLPSQINMLKLCLFLDVHMEDLIITDRDTAGIVRTPDLEPMDADIDAKETGKLLSYRMRRKQLAVRDIQDAFDFMDPAAVRKWRSGKSLPSLEHLLNLSILLNVHMETLFYTSVNKNVDEMAEEYERERQNVYEIWLRRQYEIHGRGTDFEDFKTTAGKYVKKFLVSSAGEGLSEEESGQEQEEWAWLIRLLRERKQEQEESLARYEEYLDEHPDEYAWMIEADDAYWERHARNIDKS